MCSIWGNGEHSQIPTDEQKQIKFTKTLYDMDDYLTSHGIHYRLSCGTMLTAYRENRFISYDLDIDLEILINDYNPSIEKGNKTSNATVVIVTQFLGTNLHLIIEKLISMSIYFSCMTKKTIDGMLVIMVSATWVKQNV